MTESKALPDDIAETDTQQHQKSRMQAIETDTPSAPQTLSTQKRPLTKFKVERF